MDWTLRRGSARITLRAQFGFGCGFSGVPFVTDGRSPKVPAMACQTLAKVDPLGVEPRLAEFLFCCVGGRVNVGRVHGVRPAS